jgi:cytosine/adenosine deaminase-related metal-dependent hydrolase
VAHAGPQPAAAADYAGRAALRHHERRKALASRRQGRSLTPGKEADVIILDAEAINVAPLNHVPGAVVSLMDRTNVETVIVAGAIRKWKGKLVGANIDKLRNDLENSRDHVFAAAGVPVDLFSAA